MDIEDDEDEFMKAIMKTTSKDLMTLMRLMRMIKWILKVQKGK